MGRRSTLTQLDEPIQAEVARLVRAGWTIDDIKAQLAQLGADVSRSAVGRHVKNAREVMKRYTDAQEISKGWAEQVRDEPNGDVARLLWQMLSGLAFKTVDDMGVSTNPVKPMDLMLLSKMIKDLNASTKDGLSIAKTRAEAQAQAKRELLAEQASKLDAMPAAAGVTATTKAAIREALGIA